MFDFLKKKITGFIDKITQKEEQGDRPPAKSIAPPAQKITEKKIEQKPKTVTLGDKPLDKPLATPVTEMPATKTPKSSPGTPPATPAIKPDAKPIEPAPARVETIPEPKKPAALEKTKATQKEKPPAAISLHPMEKSVTTPSSKPEETNQIPHPVPKDTKKDRVAIPPPKMESGRAVGVDVPDSDVKPRAVNLGILSALQGLVTGEIEIKKEEVQPLLEEFELELLESDVALEVAEAVRGELYAQLVGARVKHGQVSAFVQRTIGDTLLSLLENSRQFSLVERIAQNEKPVKIMFLGPNGAGKTTTMAKMAKQLTSHGYTVVFAAGDTFRAAAIEQLGIHAERLGVPVIRRPYGSDATAVAYDAVGYAKAHRIDVVLMDTAGRQDTNVNLLNELKKMQRVIQPHLKIYIGESIAGNALLEQVKTFNSELGIDGIILTKLDCDAKGGTILSISKATGIPVLYIGTGQGYDDFEEYDPKKIAQRILS